MNLKHLIAFATVLFGANAMACYTVYAPGNRVAYNGEQAPVDMSLPLHTALARANYPAGSTMVFEQGATCRPLSVALQVRAETPVASVPDTRVMGAGPASGTIVRTPVTRVARQASTSPLITQRSYAESMHLPYRVLSGDIVMVSSQAAARADLPNVTVVPGMPAQQIARAMRGDTVITEMRNPPMTVVQTGNDTIITQ